MNKRISNLKTCLKKRVGLFIEHGEKDSQDFVGSGITGGSGVGDGRTVET